jgi:hypothetical protein
MLVPYLHETTQFIVQLMYRDSRFIDNLKFEDIRSPTFRENVICFIEERRSLPHQNRAVYNSLRDMHEQQYSATQLCNLCGI